MREQERRESLQLVPLLVGVLAILACLAFLFAGLFVLPGTGTRALDALLWGVYGGGITGTFLILRKVALRPWERRRCEKDVGRLVRQS